MHFRVATRGFLKKNIFLNEFSLLASFHSPSEVAATQLHKKMILGQPSKYLQFFEEQESSESSFFL